MTDKACTMDDRWTGQELRQAREQQGLDRQAVARELKLPLRVIEQLESLQDLDSADVYQRGYLRRYARLLGYDWQAVPAAEPTVPAAVELLPRKRRSALGRYWPVPALLLAWVGWQQWHGGAPERESQPVAPAVVAVEPDSRPEQVLLASMEGGVRRQQELPVLTTVTPQPEPPGAAAEQDGPTAASRLSPIGQAHAMEQEPAGPQTVPLLPQHYLLQFRGEAWVEVRDARQQRLAYRLFHAGESLMLEGEPPYELLIGDWRVTTLRVEGRPVDLSAFAQGNVVHINTRSLVPDGSEVRAAAGNGSEPAAPARPMQP